MEGGGGKSLFVECRCVIRFLVCSRAGEGHPQWIFVGGAGVCVHGSSFRLRGPLAARDAFACVWGGRGTQVMGAC